MSRSPDVSALPKPSHLSAAYADQFADASVVRAYPHRPPYPAQTFDRLLALMEADPGPVLDVGCGTGDVARLLGGWGTLVHAIDRSPAMLAAARKLPHADRVTWIEGDVETAPLGGPYALVTAAESLHWMEWSIVLPRLAQVLRPGGRLVLVSRHADPAPWDDALAEIIPRYSTNRDYEPTDLVDELTTRGLFTVGGEAATEPLAFAQSVEGYVESFHSRNGFSRDRMRPQDADAFDAEVRALVTPFADDGKLRHSIRGRLIWGRPEGACAPS